MSKILDKIFWVRVNEPNSIKAILFNKLYSYYLDYPILFLFFNKRILNKNKLICDYILMIIIVNLIT